MSLQAKVEGEDPSEIDVVALENGRYRISFEGQDTTVDAEDIGVGRLLLKIDGRIFQVGHTPWELGVDVEYRGRKHRVDIGDPRRRLLSGSGGGLKGPQEISSPMPGKVIRVLVETGQHVEEGEGLVIVEAMKMENEYKAPYAGIIEKVFVKAGETLDAGAKMVLINPEEIEA